MVDVVVVAVRVVCGCVCHLKLWVVFNVEQHCGAHFVFHQRRNFLLFINVYINWIERKSEKK